MPTPEDPIRIRRRMSGNPGAPSQLLNAEPAYNEIEDVLYIGIGIGGDGNASAIRAIAGAGVFATKAFVAAAVAAVDVTSQLSSYLTVSAASSTYAPLASPALSGTPTAPTATAGTASGQIATTQFVSTALGAYLLSSTASSTYLAQAAAASTYAPLASPSLSGTPTAPTAASSTNSTQIATTAYVQAVISALIAGAPGALDTLSELAASLGNDASFASTVTNALAARLIAASNLSDLTDKAAARSNLQLGSMATQSAGNVAITGGTITGITIDGGSF